jgi:hypothetical protein
MKISQAAKVTERGSTTSNEILKGGKRKAFTRLIDIENGEIVGQGEMTPATAKRLARLYEAYGYYVRIA